MEDGSFRKNIPLTPESIIYSVGVGEDISFDLLLSDKYNCNIYLIDPTKRAEKTLSGNIGLLRF